ncbi:MAG TPA: inorganic phosphate transporter [Gemmatimonadaceae bacterium]|nr:inorganic phosphate transporter [Gemmatimonadaceae bacterium]
MLYYVLAIVIVALIFDFINGFHDSANSIATIVGTRVLSPVAAVIWAAFFNFIAAFVFTTAVAKAIGKGLIDLNIVTPNVILAGLVGAIIWDLVTWFYGIPSSSSHALIGGYAGAAIAKAGFGALLWGRKWIETLSFIVVSPLFGMFLGFVLMVMLYWMFQRMAPVRVNRFFRRGQLISSAMFSLAHGGNDAQKTMGIIVGLLVVVEPLLAQETGWLRNLYVPNADEIPLWVILSAHAAIALGTLFGGWRIVHTMGSRITKLRPIGGFAAEGAGAIAIIMATTMGIPVSTTHTITGAIVGVGATNRLSGVRWGLAGRIVWAWVLTIPASALIAAATYLLLRTFVGA